MHAVLGARGQDQGRLFGGSEPKLPLPPALTGVTALGRLEPKGGVLRIAGPSRPAVVIAQLLVAEGDTVRPGQVIAILDSFVAEEAQVARLKAELKNAETEHQRYQELYRDGIASVSERDAWQLRVDVARAELQRAQAELDASVVRAPVGGRVLTVHAHPGEKVGADGIAEIGNTEQMDVVAQVYETDIGRVRLGQRATITSQALRGLLEGTVEQIGLKVGKLDVFDTNPAASTDARVVAVRIRLDDSQQVAGLTNLQVEVAISV